MFSSSKKKSHFPSVKNHYFVIFCQNVLIQKVGVKMMGVQNAEIWPGYAQFYFLKDDYCIFWYLVYLLKFCQICRKFDHFFKSWTIFKNKIHKMSKKCSYYFLENIDAHNLAKFDLSRFFWNLVLTVFVKSPKIAIYQFWLFFRQNRSKFS